jgi:hypothetical protein
LTGPTSGLLGNPLANRRLGTTKPQPVRLARLRRSIKSLPRVLKAAFAVTDRKRWLKNAKESPSWDERNELIAQYIPAHSSILDLGAGAQTLRRHAPSARLYVPCDIVRSTPDCIVCDFNRGIYPPADQTYDITICSGVLEYLHEPFDFLERIRAYSKTFILSYQPAIGARAEKMERLAHGFVNDLSREELEAHLQRAGYRCECVAKWQAQLIYRLERG